MNLLEGKVCIITGAGRGIGKATAIKFAEEGAKVVVAEFDETSGQSTADAVGGAFVKTNVSDKDNVDALIQSTMDAFGRIDVLVNNAGILMDGTLAKMEEDQFDAVINVNLKGVYLCGRAVSNIMKEQGSGVILNASSVVAHNGNFGQTNYVATKSGVIGMTKVWARELGKDGIRVNAVAPGFIKTDMTAQMPEKIIQMMGDKVPLKRWGEPEDIANVYCFLASDEASYISGTVLNVDGGVVV
ncbi:MAG: beta-ketoacyl-ACP reductase [Candidatus Marinimicrobia bacterium]|jgi:3-oxoacyl-[acyl-carrier protein] reductase|nr:beta-ketoacyl-ACP reductase [Candidatus Neomarinimicrobiota bacterium]MDP6611954.1 beta-ketoacyl-ACP reductase [Candidatus Neomarinimicrobiota bacterium]|tara:strand:- start:20029 stop:20757 length:729 start_codon:yes stop_codon:yes gene_type:complete